MYGGKEQLKNAIKQSYQDASQLSKNTSLPAKPKEQLTVNALVLEAAHE